MLQYMTTQGHLSGEGVGQVSLAEAEYDKHHNYNISYCFDLIILENVLIFPITFQYFFSFSGLQVGLSFNEI